MEFRAGELDESISPDQMLTEAGKDAEQMPAASIIRQAKSTQTLVWMATVAIASIVLVCLTTTSRSSLAADENLVESFAGAKPAWRLVEENCGVVITSHQRVRAETENNSTFESLEFTSGSGTRAYWQYDIEPVLVIRELIPSVWIRSNRPHVQLHALVVLPNTLAPDGRQPIRFLVDGPAYTDVGRWQKLTFAHLENDIATLVKQKVVIYRRSLGADVVDESGAYVAALVVNGYGGIGASQVQFDDITLEGNIPWDGLASDATPTATNHDLRDASRIAVTPDSERAQRAQHLMGDETQTGHSMSVVAQANGQIEVNGVPFFARAIQHRGEALYDLREMGFNTVLLDHPPTAALAEEAAAGGMWLICPPHVQPIRNGHSLYRRVLAWNLGHGLVLENLAAVRNRGVELANRPDLPRRPTYAHIHQGISLFGQYVDIVEIGRPVTGTSFSATEYFGWLRRRLNQAPKRATVWGTVSTQYPRSLLDQAGRLTRLRHEPTVSIDELESIAIESLAAGCRGLVFQSQSRLDELDRETGRRARILEWLNGELAPLEPWIAAGTVVGEKRVSQSGVVSDTISTNRAELILVRRRTMRSSRGGGQPDPVTLHLNQSSLVSSAYLLTSHGATPLRHDRRTASLRLRLEKVYGCAKVVVTQDPLALQHITNAGGESAQDHVTLHADCLADWRVNLDGVLTQLVNDGVNTSKSSRLTQEAGSSLTQARRFLLSGDSRTADALLRSTQWQLAEATKDLINTLRAPFPNPLASPLLVVAEWLPEHVRLGSDLASSNWSLNSMPAGQFRSLEHLQHSGWSNHRSPDERLVTSVDLIPTSEQSDDHFLRLKVEPTASLARHELLEATPLWIVSPPIHTRANDIVRIHGRVRFRATHPEHQGELLIIDSLGGLTLAERYQDNTEWREFTMYRAANDQHELRITFAMTGPGVAWLDDLEVQTTELIVR